MNNCLQEHLIDNDEQGSANDLYLIGLSELELKNFDSALESINRARKFFKEAKDLISVGRCDHKISRALNEKGEYQGATEAAQRALDVFITARDNVRELYARWELGKAQFKLENIIDALENFEKVLDLLLEEDPKDFNFILEVEEKISQILEQNGNEAEARELARRIANVREILKD
jgi:tetratricopeptide (TPR) repeat protein